MGALTPEETIMVVDDDDNVREMMRRTLELEGYRVLAARNGAHALNVAAEHATRIHLIVSDMRMPEMGGSELIEVVRRWWPGLRCLVVSGYADFADRLDAFGGAPTEFLPKPFSVDDLAGAVRELLDRPARPKAAPHVRPGSRIAPATPRGERAIARAETQIPVARATEPDDIAGIADEIVTAMEGPGVDPRLKRLPNGHIRVLTSAAFPAGSESPDTVEARRSALSREVEARLRERGWQRVRPNVFERTDDPPARYRVQRQRVRPSAVIATPDLSLIAPEQQTRAVAQLRAGDVAGFLHTASSELHLAIVVGNVEYLRGRGLLEPAIVEVFTSRATNNHRIYRDLRFLLGFADRDRLRAAGDPLPGGGPWTAYRGVGGAGANRRIRGYSWTADIERARRFADRAAAWGLDHPAVYAATFTVDSVLFYRRDEQDFVLHLDEDHAVVRVP